MPKKKVDELHGIRIELQASEREALETYLMSSSVRNVGQGIGAVLKPLLDNWGIILAALIAKEGWPAIEGWFQADNPEGSVPTGFLAPWKTGWWAIQRAAGDDEVGMTEEEWLVAHYEEYVADPNTQPPIMTYEEYTENVTKESTAYKRATGWRDTVNSMIWWIPGQNQKNPKTGKKWGFW